MTLDLTEAEYLELRVAALSRRDLLIRAMQDPDFSDEERGRHHQDLRDITSAHNKLWAAYTASTEVA